MATLTIEEAIALGMGRSMTVGAFSTGIVGGGAGTVLDLDQPEFAVAVPAGYVIRPFYVEIAVQGGISTLDSDETEALLAADSRSRWAGDGTFTAEQPSNLRSDLVEGSACLCGSAFTADMTTTNEVGTAADPNLDMELARIVETADQAGTAANVAYRVIRLVYEPRYAPYLVGPCTLLGYWGGTVATVGGFAVVQWVEGKISDLLPAI